MKTIIMLVAVAFATVQGIDIISSNTSSVIVNHVHNTNTVIDDATR